MSSLFPSSKQHHLLDRIQHASSYTQWREAQEEFEYLNNIHVWRNRTESDGISGDSYPYELVKTHQLQLENALISQNSQLLLSTLTEGLYRLLNELSESWLYQKSSLGSKNLSASYFDTIERSIAALANASDIPSHEKLQLLRVARKNLGAPALMLSGGGTFGIYHLGVIKALHEQALIPEIISGTSMGSIAAGILASHNDEELSALFANPHQQDYAPLKKLSWRDSKQQGCLLDHKRLYDCIESNIGDITFQEAFERTKRVVSITVSPTRKSQKPRILNHLTSPNVLIAHASKASCSVPGLFPAVQLQQRKDGKNLAYCSDELWMDGSFATDIPRNRMSRLFNVNFFIVSQANPHILPFVSAEQTPGFLPMLKDLLTESAYAQCLTLLKVARKRNTQSFLRSWIDQCVSMLDQDYQGDITIHPKFPLSWYRKFMVNPSPEELDYLIKLGERATWPKLAQIAEQTRLYRALSKAIAELESNQQSNT